MSLIMQAHLSEVSQSLLPSCRKSKKGKYHKLKEAAIVTTTQSSTVPSKRKTKKKVMMKSPPRRSLSAGPIDLDEDIEDEKIMLVEIEQVLRDKELRRKIQQTNSNSGSCSSVSSCSHTSSTASFSDDSSSVVKEISGSRRVVFSDQVQCIPAVQWDKSVDRRNLWWSRKDREAALNAMRSEARVLASSAKYRGACTAILLHCKAISGANEEECLEEDHGVVPGTRSQRLLTGETPKHVREAVRYLTEAQVRGLERACLQRLRLRTPGRPCYYWRCSPVRATANVLQLQDRLSNILDLSNQEKGCLISVQYQPYGFYASVWARLLAEGDAVEEHREFQRVTL